MYCQLGHWEQISVKFQTKRIFIQETEFEKVNIKMVAILSLPQHVDQIILLFDNCTQYHDIDLNKWQKCAWFSIAHFLIEYGTQDVNKGCKVLHACESQGLTLRTFYQNHWLGEMAYCFPRSSVKFQGYTGQIIANFDLNWAFLDYNSSLNSIIALK